MSRLPSRVHGVTASPADLPVDLNGADPGAAATGTSTSDISDRPRRHEQPRPAPDQPQTGPPDGGAPPGPSGADRDRGSGPDSEQTSHRSPDPPGTSQPDGGDAPGAGGRLGAGEPVRLPERVRARVVALAADALGRLQAEEVPVSLRAVARFTPAKRARLGSTALAAALETDAAFRLSAAARAEQTGPDIVAAVREGAVPSVADPVELAAVAYLLRTEDWPQYVDRARSALDEAVELDRARARDEELERLRAELAAAQAGAAAELAGVETAADEARTAAEALRRQLREQIGLRRAAERARTTAEEALAEERRRVGGVESAANAELRRLRQRLAEAEDAVESARRAARESRQADEARLWLLLDTVAGAVQGLRRELALTPSDDRPADAVSTAAPGQHHLGARGDDPEQLDRLLALPRVHLVVDGYNVTKSGYGDLPLAVQRKRLTGGLGALAARTGVEISCVFDGAARPPSAPPAPRGVRVLFSAPGESADDLIRRLVAAEPIGRPVVVVSSDREVADGVRRAGVYPVPSVVLLRRLDRG